ncbi:MAG: hypothetical protein PHV34_15415 [Verrucomicrobiae bacterium]|nr:hypothetical protein [Verrucomicrobiae bacterium]
MKSSSPNGKTSAIPIWTTFLLLLVIMVSWSVRLRLGSMPLERDEGEYACMGQLLLQGVPPYTEAFGMKFPGIYLLYAAILQFIGQNEVSIRVGLLLANGIAAIGIFLLGQRFERDESNDDSPEFFRLVPLGLWMASAFSILTLAPAMLGISANAEHFVLPFVCASMPLLHAAENRRNIFISGLLLGCAAAVKQQGAAFALWGFLWVGMKTFRHPQKSPVFATLVSMALFGIGFVLPLAVIAIWLKQAGAWDSFFFWTIQYARHYGSQWGLRDGMAHFCSQFAPIARDHAFFFIPVAAGLLCLFRQRRMEAIFAIGLIGAGLLAASPGLIFRNHYFLFLCPGLAIVFALGFDIFRARWGQLAAGFICLGLLISPVMIQFNLLFRLRPEQVCRQLYWRTPFVEIRQLALQLRSQIPSGEPIAIIGSEPQISFYSGRRSFLPYLYLYPLFEPQPFATQMQDDVKARLEKNPPRFLVHIKVPSSWLLYPGSRRDFLDWLPGYLSKHYTSRSVQTIRSTKFHWELVVYERRP